jgi:ribosomal protein L7/L12
VADGLIVAVCEELVQGVGLKDGKPVVERVPTAVLELLLLTDGEALEERSPERVFEPRGDALTVL